MHSWVVLPITPVEVLVGEDYEVSSSGPGFPVLQLLSVYYRGHGNLVSIVQEIREETPFLKQ